MLRRYIYILPPCLISHFICLLLFIILCWLTLYFYPFLFCSWRELLLPSSLMECKEDWYLLQYLFYWIFQLKSDWNLWIVETQCCYHFIWYHVVQSLFFLSLIILNRSALNSTNIHRYIYPRSSTFSRTSLIWGCCMFGDILTKSLLVTRFQKLFPGLNERGSSLLLLRLWFLQRTLQKSIITTSKKDPSLMACAISLAPDQSSPWSELCSHILYLLHRVSKVA